MTVELYVVLSICIILCIYLNKQDKKDQMKKEQQKVIARQNRKSADEISDMYFESLRKIDDMYREFKERDLKNEISKEV